MLRSLATITGAALLLAALLHLRRALVTRRARRPRPRRRATERLCRRLAGAFAPWAGRVSWLRQEIRAPRVRTDCVLAAPQCLVARVVEPGAPPKRVAELMAGMRACSVAAGGVAALALVLVAGAVMLPAGALVVLVAAALPDATVSRAAAAARRRVDADLPGALDLLAAGARAGVALEGGLAMAAQHSRGSLRMVLERVILRQRSGQGAAAALLTEAEKLDLATLASVAAVIDRNDRLGLAIDPALRSLADAGRSRQEVASAARAARAASLASVVTAAVIAPACVAAIATALLALVLSTGVVQP